MRIKNRMTRRGALAALGTMGVAPWIPATGPEAEAAGPPPAEDVPRRGSDGAPRLHRLVRGGMAVEFDTETGTLHSISRPGDPLATNFLGNRTNTSGQARRDLHWTGDVVTTVWELRTREWVREQSPDPAVVHRPSGRWRRESTLDSDDSRRVAVDGASFRVGYDRPSSNPEGIRSFTLDGVFTLSPEGVLAWDLRLANAIDRTLEIGELAFPLRANDDYVGPYGGLSTREATVQGKMTAIQKVIHEQRVLAHFFVAGHGSYALLQRPDGGGPFLLVRGDGDTPFECLYKTRGPYGGDWIGTELMAVHSWAACQQRGWSWNPWINGHSSLVLEPGESRSLRLTFEFIDDYDAIRERLARGGDLGLRIVPAMVVEEGTDVRVEAKGSGLDDIEIHSDGVLLKERARAGGATLLTLAFRGWGQKSLKLRYGGGRWTWLHFYCVEDAARLIKARARFMATRQFYENPADPYGRHHLFLPFDDHVGTRIDEAPDAWEVGGTGDPGFGDPLFLAEKNAVYPSAEEIGTLEAYVDDCLFRNIQDPKTYEVRESLYWKVRTPSSSSGSYSKARSEATWRTYNYAFVANIYHTLYRIGRRYGLLRRRAAEDYLRMCWRTCLMWFTTGPYKFVGMISGSNAVEILADLAREGWEEEHGRLLALMRECNAEFLRDPYPYSSEIEIDETGQPQVYYFTRLFAGLGDAESGAKRAAVVRVLKALRGGDQPVWFNYGNDLFAHPDLRGQLSCWHSESINGMTLLSHFEETGDRTALMKGYPGVTSVLHNVRPDGMGFAWYVYAPGILGYEPARTFEGGLGLWGFLRAAASYVVEDPAFGWVGYGCRVERDAGEVRVWLQDGVRKRLRFPAEGIAVDAEAGEIASASLEARSGALTFRMEDSTGLVRTVLLKVRGLRPGTYEVGHAGGTERHEARDVLSLEVPVERAGTITIRRAAKRGSP